MNLSYIIMEEKPVIYNLDSEDECDHGRQSNRLEKKNNWKK